MSERAVAQTLERCGYKALRNGWPDFLCVNESTGAVACVEVKGSGDKIRPSQEENHRILGAIGLPVYVVHPRDVHALISDMKTIDVLPQGNVRISQRVRAQSEAIRALKDVVESYRTFLNNCRFSPELRDEANKCLLKDNNVQRVLNNMQGEHRIGLTLSEWDRKIDDGTEHAAQAVG